MRDINRRFEANQEQEVAAKGDFIFLKSATGAVSIDIQGRGVVGFEVGDSIKVKDAFSGFRIINKTDAINLVEVSVGDGDEFGRSLVSGKFEVTNLPVKYADEKAGLIFGFESSGYASKPAVQLWNPANSGKNLFFGGVDASFNLTSDFFACRANSIVGSMITELPIKFNPSGDESIGRVYASSDNGVPTYGRVLSARLGGSKHISFDMLNGLIIEPDNGLLLISTETNVYFKISFRYKEESINV